MPARLVVLVALLALAQPPRAVDHGRGGLAGEGQATANAEALVVNSLGMRFVRIPAGSFDMGSNVRKPEQPVHRVDVPSFWMGVTEVTQGQWQAVTGNNPSHFKEAGANAPVEMVSWQDAQAFIWKLNELEPGRRYRLPSEAEWEYACRATSGDDPYGPVEEIAWIKENSGGTTHPVGLKRPNGFGLYDMLGNVSEWTQDAWHPGYDGAPTDGSAWTSGGGQQHTLRGGGWDLPAFFIHSALRGPYDPIHRLGFRLVCVPVTVVSAENRETLRLPFVWTAPSKPDTLEAYGSEVHERKALACGRCPQPLVERHQGQRRGAALSAEPGGRQLESVGGAQRVNAQHAASHLAHFVAGVDLDPARLQRIEPTERLGGLGRRQRSVALEPGDG